MQGSRLISNPVTNIDYLGNNPALGGRFYQVEMGSQVTDDQRKLISVEF